MASPKLWCEIWRRPGHATFGKVIADIPVVTASGTVTVNGVGEGRVTIPKSYDRLDEILKPDPTTPANAVSSLVRVFSESSTTPIYEFIPAVFMGEQDKADPDIEIVGPAVDVIWGYARLEPWDWTGIDEEHSDWPDWIWGGRNVLGDLESVYLPAVTNLHRDPVVTGGTFTIGVSFNGGAIQNTAAIAWNATAATVDTELTATAYITSVEVSGSGSTADPWRIQTVLPEGEYVFSVNSGGLTPSGLVFQDRETIGAILPAGWTVSFNPVNNISHGSVDVLRAEPLAAYTPVPACATTGLGIYFDAGAGDFPGIQKITPVKPGGRYYARIMARPIGGSFVGRLVIRDLFENGIAVDPSYDSGTTLTADTWTEMFIPIVSMPADVDRVIFRFASVSGSNAPPIVVACMELREGMPPTTWGDIFTQLWLDATSDHAGRQVWQIGAGATNFLTLDFSASVNTLGAAWTHPEVSITLKRGQSYLRVIGEAAKMGYEWRIVPNSVSAGTWKLQVYNIGTMGTDQSAISTGPSIQGGRDVTRRDLRRMLPPATDVAVEAGGQNIARARSTTAITALGRIEQYIPNQDLGSLVEAATSAVQGVAVNLSRSQSLSYVLTPTTLDPEPFIDYKAADTLYVLDPPDVPTRTARRIKSLGFAFTKDRVEYTAQLESDSYVGVQGIAQSVDFLLKEFKAIRERPDETTDILNYFPLGGTGTPTVVIAAYNATLLSQDKADFICTGTADEGIFNIALGILASVLKDGGTFVGGRIVLTEGDYYLSTTLILHQGVRIEGMGTDATFLHSAVNSSLATAVNATMISVDHTVGTGADQPISLAHFDMNGHKAIQTSGTAHGLYVEPNGGTVISLDHVSIHDFRTNGANFDRCADTVYIDRCSFKSNTGKGIDMAVEGYFHVLNSVMSLNTGLGIKADGADLKMIGCVIQSNGGGGFSAGGVFEATPKILIGNEISSNTGAGIAWDAAAGVIADNYVASNTTDGISVAGVAPVIIIGNTVASNTNRGIVLTGGAGNLGGLCEHNVVKLNGQHGIYIGSDDWTVQNNHVTNNSRTTTNTYDGIHVAAGVDMSVLSNMVRQTTGAPVQRYGINILAGATGCWRAGNDCRGGGWGTAAYVDAGAASILVWAGGFGDNQ